jgi:hypothetical protein
MLAKLRGPVDSAARLQLSRKDQASPIEVAVLRDRNKVVLKARVQHGTLVIENIGGLNAFEFETGKPTAVAPLSEATFYVDGRYHTEIAFTKDASGRITAATLNPGPWQQNGVRVD